MTTLAVLWIGVGIGFIIGRWNRGNDLDIKISLSDAIKWIEDNGANRSEKAHMVDLLIFLTDGKEDDENG